MHPPPPAQALQQKAAIGAVEKMEETMRVLTLIELMRLSKIELCDLAGADHQRLSGLSGRLTRAS
jgi:hypothetical protein